MQYAIRPINAAAYLLNLYLMNRQASVIPIHQVNLTSPRFSGPSWTDPITGKTYAKNTWWVPKEKYQQGVRSRGR